MKPRTLLGVDPGGTNTGIVIRRSGDELLWHALVSRGSDDHAYLDEILCHLCAAIEDTPVDGVAIEGIVEPTPHMGLTNVAGIVNTGVVFGLVAGWTLAQPPTGMDAGPTLPLWVVRPGGHGIVGAELGRMGLLGAYPRELVGDREEVGTGKLKDVRAAWDVAGHAMVRSQKAAQGVQLAMSRE